MATTITPKRNKAAQALVKNAVAGLPSTLHKLLEDIPNHIMNQALATNLHKLVSVLLTGLGVIHERRRREALLCLNSLVFLKSGLLVAHMNDYLGGLSTLASNLSP